MIKLIAPGDGEMLNLLTEIQAAFIADEEGRKKISGGEKFHWNEILESGEERSIPRPVHFVWQSDVPGGTVQLSLDDGFAKVREYRSDGFEADVYNLLYGVKYFWRVVTYHGEVSPVRTFSIDITPRFIYVDGTTNVRDIGLWKTQNGRVKQGLFYRGSELNRHIEVTEKGLKTLSEELCVKTDLDLRGMEIDSMTEFPCSSVGIDWVHAPVVAYAHLYRDLFIPCVVKFFEIVSDKSIYPLYAHCWGGCDRAGSMCLFLEALLGVDMKDIILDYELSSLSIWNIRTRNYSEFIEFTDRLLSFGGEGDSLADKTRICLTKHFGIRESVLDDICDIFREMA